MVNHLISIFMVFNVRLVAQIKIIKMKVDSLWNFREGKKICSSKNVKTKDIVTHFYK